MLNNFDYKLIVSLVSVALVLYGYFPYIRDIFLKKTTPHLYTWLVWIITQGTATVAIWRGGGNYGVFGFVVGTALVLFVFLLSFKFGTKNIKRSDTIALLLALSAVFVWWQMNNPVLAVFMVSIIDGIGFVPTFRKSFEEPWSETLSFWFIMAVANVLILISIAEYNFLTVAYPVTLVIANFAVWGICFFGRRRARIATNGKKER
jgi:hypothetical protein